MDRTTAGVGVISQDCAHRFGLVVHIWRHPPHDTSYVDKTVLFGGKRSPNDFNVISGYDNEMFRKVRSHGGFHHGDFHHAEGHALIPVDPPCCCPLCRDEVPVEMASGTSSRQSGHGQVERSGADVSSSTSRSIITHPELAASWLHIAEITMTDDSMAPPFLRHRMVVTKENIEPIRAALPADQRDLIGIGCIAWRMPENVDSWAEPFGSTITYWPKTGRGAIYEDGTLDGPSWGTWRMGELWLDEGLVIDATGRILRVDFRQGPPALD